MGGKWAMTKWQRKLSQNFPEAWRPEGNGPFAAMFPCGELTVELFPTAERARGAIPV